jgi:hypothetical protein
MAIQRMLRHPHGSGAGEAGARTRACAVAACRRGGAGRADGRGPAGQSGRRDRGQRQGRNRGHGQRPGRARGMRQQCEGRRARRDGADRRRRPALRQQQVPPVRATWYRNSNQTNALCYQNEAGGASHLRTFRALAGTTRIEPTMRSIVQHNVPVIKRLRWITSRYLRGRLADHAEEQRGYGKGSLQLGTCSGRRPGTSAAAGDLLQR